MARFLIIDTEKRPADAKVGTFLNCSQFSIFNHGAVDITYKLIDNVDEESEGFVRAGRSRNLPYEKNKIYEKVTYDATGSEVEIIVIF